jgi:hypothetical protein
MMYPAQLVNNADAVSDSPGTSTLATADSIPYPLPRLLVPYAWEGLAAGAQTDDWVLRSVNVAFPNASIATGATLGPLGAAFLPELRVAGPSDVRTAGLVNAPSASRALKTFSSTYTSLRDVSALVDCIQIVASLTLFKFVFNVPIPRRYYPAIRQTAVGVALTNAVWSFDIVRTSLTRVTAVTLS